MHDSKIGFREWAVAIFLVATNIKGNSSTKLVNDIGVKQKTSWYMTMRINQAYSNVTAIFKVAIEVDETYIGVNEAKNHKNKKLNSGRGAGGKVAVVNIKERETGFIVAKTVTCTTKRDSAVLYSRYSLRR